MDGIDWMDWDYGTNGGFDGMVQVDGIDGFFTHTGLVGGELGCLGGYGSGLFWFFL